MDALCGRFAHGMGCLHEWSDLAVTVGCNIRHRFENGPWQDSEARRHAFEVIRR